MLQPKFEPIWTLIQNETKRAFMQTALKNYFNRQFLKHELIPLMEVSLSVCDSPISSHDSGGQCGAPAVCPSPYSSQNGHDQYCDNRKLGSNYCGGNPVDGPTQAEFDEKVSQVETNKTALRKRIQLVSDQAATMLKSNLVSEVAIAGVALEYGFIMSTLQASLEEEQCGWTFNCRTAWWNAQPWGWHNEEGPHTRYVSRKFTYIKGLL